MNEQCPTSEEIHVARRERNREIMAFFVMLILLMFALDAFVNIIAACLS